MNHSQRHYQEHLHAYAMNTETKRVWDYAGEGYVHRLILSRPDTVESSTTSQTDLLPIASLAFTTQSSGESKGPIFGFVLDFLHYPQRLFLLVLKLWKCLIPEDLKMAIALNTRHSLRFKKTIS
jgi:hypothetical protein